MRLYCLSKVFPGIGMFSRSFKFFSKLSEDDAFWERGLRGYTKQKCFREVDIDEKGKSRIKYWFAMQDGLRENGRMLLVRRWLQDNPKVVEEFKLDIPVFGMVKDSKHRTRALVSSNGSEIAITGIPNASSNPFISM